MAVYFANTEITGIKDLFPLLSKDITGLYFADTELFTVWAEYDGALPATYSANGSMLADYRVYGANGGVGDDSGTAYGYSLLMSVRSENLFDPSDTVPDYRYDDNGNWVNDNGVLSSGYIKVAAGDKYEYTFKTISGKNNGICRINFLNANGQWLSVKKVSFNAAVGDTVTVSGTVPAGTAFIRTSQYNGELNISMIVAADTTPIYIGDTPLEEDEYVSFKEQKVYKRTENLFNKANAKIGSLTYSGEELSSTTAIRSDYIDVTPGETYYVNVYDGFYFQYCAGYNGKMFVTAIASNTPPLPLRQVIIIPENVDSIRIVFRKSKTQPYPEITNVNLINATVTSLQPTDPPVPLSALPTVDGTNIVDYAGQSAAPEKFYAKYRKEGFK